MKQSSKGVQNKKKKKSKRKNKNKKTKQRNKKQIRSYKRPLDVKN